MASMISSSLGQVGQAIQNAPAEVYQATGLGDIAAGLQGLFGGDQATAPTVEPFVGPPSPYAPPTFAQALTRGLTGQNVAGGADVVPPGAQTAGGLGELIAMLDKIAQGGGGGLPPMVRTPGSGGPTGVQILPGYTQASAPQGGLIHNLIKSYTFGLLNSQLGGIAGLGGR